MGRIKAMTKKSAIEKWVAESARLDKRMAETIERIDRILAKEKETRK